ncbi:esterase/lipase family protein [Gordonia insulae]|uniref:Lipase EstA n=1 Tax=Gordonia insulae TaxID=2420509 RepID=A0A3G8JSH2_9ACTN|nr:alpha/beta fold hydrolase [Gordonia insulae]AZG47442.1 Lipase EstA [Gordonia insulae]
MSIIRSTGVTSRAVRAGATIAMVIACALAVLGAGPASAAPRAPLPESYNFFSGIPPELAHPGGSLPGSNDFTCRPSARHPRPVVLVHGTGGSQQTNWGAYVAMLANRGYCVFALTYGALPGAPWPVSAIGGMTRMEPSAAALSRFVDRVLASTGAKTVDLVGHSQGTYMPTYYLKYLGGAPKVTKYVSLAPLWRGSFEGTPFVPLAKAILGDADMPICAACGQMGAGTPMNAAIWRGGSPYVRGIDYTNISTRYDELVVPYTAGQVPGRAGEQVRNIVVQDSCPQDHSEHMAIAGSRRAAFMVLNALDPAHPVRVPCEYVPPFTG